jgi:hypothetical protein
MSSPVTIPATGIWLISYVIRLNISSSGTATMTIYQTSIGIGANSYGISNNCATQSLGINAQVCNTGSFTLPLNSGTGIALNIFTAYTLISGGPVGSDNTNSYVQLTRIG